MSNIKIVGRHLAPGRRWGEAEGSRSLSSARRVTRRTPTQDKLAILHAFPSVEDDSAPCKCTCTKQAALGFVEMTSVAGA